MRKAASLAVAILFATLSTQVGYGQDMSVGLVAYRTFDETLSLSGSADDENCSSDMINSVADGSFRIRRLSSSTAELSLTNEVQAVPGGQEILFGSSADGSPDTWAIDADGRNRVNLSRVSHDPNSIYTDGSARWSPDGTKILFVSNKTGVGKKVFIMDPDGSNAHPLNANNNFENDPFWGADGTKIYYGRNPAFPIGGGGCGPCPFWEIYEYDLNTDQETRLTFNNSRDEHAVASPDGNFIAFAHAERPNDCCNPRDVWIMDADGQNQRPLTAVNGRYETPRDWDPVNNKILTDWQIGCSHSSCSEVVLMDPDGTAERLTFNNIAEGGAAFSPDGSTILLGRQGDIYLLDIATRQVMPFIVEPGDQSPSDWRAVNVSPVADAGPDQTIECVGPDGASITLDGTNSSDPDNDPLTYTWTGPFGTVAGSTPTVTLPLGTHAITLTVDDGNGGTETDEVMVTVQDTTPPEMTAALVPVPDGDDGDDDDDGFAAKNADDDDSEVEGTFTVVCTATDACDANPTVTSVIAVPSLNNPTVTFKTRNKKRLKIDLEDNEVEVRGPDPQAFWADVQADGGGAVSDGAVLDIEQEDDEGEFELKFDDDGHLVEVGGPSVVLRCRATDASGNVATAEATPPLPGGDDGADKTGDPTGQAPSAQSTIPNAFSLEQNYPNPFNPVTTIAYSLPVSQHVIVTLFDALGREVATLVNEQKPPGRHEVVFDAGALPSGVYLYRLKAGTYTETRTLILAK